MTIENRYPLSTRAGQAIPLDVIKPTFLQFVNFSFSSPSSPVSLPQNANIVLLRASEDCVIQFGGSVAAVPAGGASAISNCLFLATGEVQIISIPSSILSVIGISANGTLYIQGIEVWQNLSLEIQHSRI